MLRTMLGAVLLAGVVASPAPGVPPYVVSSRTTDAPDQIWEYDLYRVTDGHRERLTTSAGPEGEPAVSSAGLLAFTAAPSGRFELYTMPLDASERPTRRAASLAQAGHPSFDPPGERLVFPADAGDGKWRLVVLTLATGETRTLVDGPSHCWAPEWSPDGRTVAFMSGEQDRSSLWLVHVETGTAERLTDDTLPEREPHWSPDGRSLAYARRLSRWSAEVRVLDLASRTSRTVVPGDTLNLQPSFTPDGTRIVFVSLRGGRFGLWTVPVAGGAPAPLDHGPWSDQSPRFLPSR